jgi:hypothetical protein
MKMPAGKGATQTRRARLSLPVARQPNIGCHTKLNLHQGMADDNTARDIR